MKKRSGFSTVIIILMLLVGLSLLLYPSFADYWNSFTQSKAIVNYAEQVAVLDENEYKQVWEDAFAYNASLKERDNPYLLSDEQKQSYHDSLNIVGNGIMGYVQIPSISVELPIYHTTSDIVLAKAIGHLDWTSLPTGGESTHCVISGHRGLPSAKLFTDLDQLVVGDLFMLHILDETLTYEVDQILIVEPEETEALLIQEGKDLCTLFTCTPYGINSHRLLIRGHRVANLEESPVIRVTADAVVLERVVVAPFILTAILLFVMIFMLIPRGKKNRRKGK